MILANIIATSIGCHVCGGISDGAVLIPVYSSFVVIELPDFSDFYIKLSTELPLSRVVIRSRLLL